MITLKTTKPVTEVTSSWVNLVQKLVRALCDLPFMNIIDQGDIPAGTQLLVHYDDRDFLITISEVENDPRKG